MDLLILFGAMATLAAQLRRLPPQNVFAIALLIIGLSFGIELFAANTGLPFSQSVSIKFFQSKSFGKVAWPVPFVWVILLVLNRNIAKAVLSRRRKAKFYGSEILILTSVLTAICYRLSLSTQSILSKDAAGLFVSAAAILICLAPWFIEKKPHPEP